jgi:hypothetical protein
VPAPTSAFLSGPADPVPGARLYAALSSAGLEPSDLGRVGRGRAVSALACRFNVDGTICPKNPQYVKDKLFSSFKTCLVFIKQYWSAAFLDISQAFDKV